MVGLAVFVYVSMLFCLAGRLYEEIYPRFIYGILPLIRIITGYGTASMCGLRVTFEWPAMA